MNRFVAVLLLGVLNWGLRAGPALGRAGPPLSFRTLTAADGLAENSVYALLQDRQGFLWAGTQDGLSRYDGGGFRTFRTDAQRPTSLASNYVLALCEDRAGHVWVGTGGGGLSRYNPRTEQFTTYRAEPGSADGLADNFVRAVLCDRQGRVWAGTENGLHRFDAAASRFPVFRHAADAGAGARRNSVRALAQDRAGAVWVGTGDGHVSCLDTARNVLRADPRLTPAGAITVLCADRAGGLWVGTDTGVLRYLPAAGGATRVFAPDGRPGSLPAGPVRAVLEDRQGRVWVGTAAGLCRYQPATGTFEVSQHQPQNPRSLPDNAVPALLQDRAGLLWVGTEEGLSCADLRPTVFSQPALGTPGPVWAVTSDSVGRVWVGTEDGGVVCFDPATGQRRQFRHDPADPGSLAQNWVRALCFDRRGRLWVGTQNQGLDCLEPGATRFVHYRHQPALPNSLVDDFVRSVYEDPGGQLWVSTEGGLNRYDPATRRFTAFRHQPNNPSSLSHNFVRVTLQDRKGLLWIGTGGGGLCRYDPLSGGFTTYRANGRDPRSLSSNFVRSLLFDRAGTLWVGTEGGGFCRLDDPITGRFTAFREAEGLPNNVVYGLTDDAQGHLWLSTNKGLARFTPRTAQFRTFDTRDGLAQDEYNAGAAHRAPDGRLYFGGVNGLVAFRPAAVRTNAVPPPVVLTGLRKFNRPAELPDTAVAARRVLHLAPEDYVFTLEFAALNLLLPDKNRYAYRLEGFDQEWVPAGARREATYTNLDPGAYTFRVRAANNDGVWNQQGASLRVVVEPPWYRTWWFRVGLSWVAFGLLVVAYRVRVGQLLTLERVRHGIARDLHDDMGSTLSSISILSQIARNHQRQQRPEQAAALLEQIGDSSRRMLDAMDDIVWAINPAHDALEDVVARMRSFASDVLEARGIEFRFEAEPSVQGLKLDMRGRREFFLLFKEAINNLAKYAQCQNARIHLGYRQGQLHLTVHDDGVGFDPAAPAQGGGNGLANMRTRAAALHGHLDITTAPGQGTKLEVKVPLG